MRGLYRSGGRFSVPHQLIYKSRDLAIARNKKKRKKKNLTMYPRKSSGPSVSQSAHVHDQQLDILDVTRQYLGVNLTSMKELKRDDSVVKLSSWSAPKISRPLFSEASTQTFVPVQKGAKFGPSWSTHWFKVDIDIPDWGAEEYHFEFDSEAEGMIYNLQGEPLHGLTGGPNDDKRYEFRLPAEWVAARKAEFWIEIGCNHRGGNCVGGHGPPVERLFELKLADLVAPNLEARALLVDFDIIKKCARLEDQSWQPHVARNVASEILKTFRLNNQESVRECRKIAQKFLGKNVDSEKVFANHADNETALITAVGNCHIDTAWLWPYDETKRKVARSWATQIDLMDRYPEYKFTASQAQQFEWLRQDYPKLFEQVQEKVKTGQFEIIGGTWVEMDANLPSGEAIARQFLHGQKFFQKHFNKLCRVFWLPDTFGYCAQLPQLCRLAGMDYGFTQKLSWNSTNVFPHSTFNWVSPDGSQLLMHMAPADTYVGQCTVEEIRKSVSNHHSLAADPRSLYLFGNGDGGGGPLPVMLERLRRIRGAADTVPGILPRVEVESSVEQFYDRLAEGKGKNLPTWSGELYLELHRGTFTTEAETKNNNRRTEILMHDVELVATVASLRGFEYPHEKLENIWRKLLLNQFHDVLPGTSIEIVYDDVDRLYAEVYEEGEQILTDALKFLGVENGTGDVALNTLQWPLPKPAVADSSSALKNDRFNVTIDNQGRISSILDNGREVLACPCTFVIFEDKPPYWQAWDTEIYSLTTRREITGQATGNVINCRISEHSSMEVTVTVLEDRVDFKVDVDWHEPEVRFLKAEFPVNVVATYASYETAFGMVERPTHFNTSWDEARFEVCCHKYADLSEHNYGVAILNQAKYGFSTHGNVMRLSLLRSSKEPNANSDMGKHSIRYAIMPHDGKLDMRVVKAAKQYNAAERTISKAIDLDLVDLNDSGSVVLEAVKRGEDGKSVVLRLYEALGAHVKAEIKPKFGFKSASLTDILEREVTKLGSDATIKLDVQPFEIVTIKLDL